MNQNESPVVYPEWLLALPPDKINAEKTRFLLRLAALHATSNGSVDAFCKRLGSGKHLLRKYLRPNNPELVGGELAAEIERLVGASVVPRAELAPHVFR